MKRDIAISGILGLVLGLFIFFFANWLKTFIPILVADFITTLVVFAILLIIALIEMPMMVFAIRLLSNTTISRRVVDSAFLFYVSFASIYALIFILFAGNDYPYFGTMLAALGLVRFVSGIFLR